MSNLAPVMRINPKVTNQHTSGESVEWGHPQLTTFVSGSKFVDCDVRINCSAGGIIISDSVFRNCTFTVKRRFSDHQFFQAGFEDCRFVGKYPGCEFGFRQLVFARQSLFSRPPMQGYVRNCDFTQAELDMASFNATDLAGIRLPQWPHFLVRSASAFAKVPEFADDAQWNLLAKMKWPPEMTGLVVRYRCNREQGFGMPAGEALSVLRRYPDFMIAAAE